MVGVLIMGCLTDHFSLLSPLKKGQNLSLRRREAKRKTLRSLCLCESLLFTSHFSLKLSVFELAADDGAEDVGLEDFAGGDGEDVTVVEGEVGEFAGGDGS